MAAINRRKMIKRTALYTAGAGLLYGGWKGYGMFKTPDKSKLHTAERLIDALAETIIPRTDTPGASDAKVYSFILWSLRENVSKKSLNNFIDNLIELKDKAYKDYKKPFEECSQTERETILSYYELESNRASGIIGKIQGKLLGESFFGLLKKLTVEGYCTSELGTNLGLAYDHIPQTYQHCVPLKPNQKAWATK